MKSKPIKCNLHILSRLEACIYYSLDSSDVLVFQQHLALVHTCLYLNVLPGNVTASCFLHLHRVFEPHFYSLQSVWMWKHVKMQS